MKERGGLGQQTARLRVDQDKKTRQERGVDQKCVIIYYSV